MPPRFAGVSPDAVPIWFAHEGDWDAVRLRLPGAAARCAETARFEPKPGRHLVVYDGDGRMTAVIAGLDAPDARRRDLFLPGRLATVLPAATYRFANEPHDPAMGALGWLLSLYRFTRYKKAGAKLPALVAPRGVDAARLERLAAGAELARDLVNTPANDMGPDALEHAATALASEYGAGAKVVRGDDLLAQNLPLIHAVGRAAAQAPRLVDFTWGCADAPKVTLVGKGVTFDTGGLDIKPESGMLLMRKDMGGAATALGLAREIMDAGLAVRLATLTGAARVALGPDLPPFFTDDDALADSLVRHGERMFDPVWRLPLWEPYDTMVEGRISDLKNVGGSSFAGAIVAALFLRRFVERTKGWAHFDIYAWNPAAQSGRPEGGDTQTARLLYDLLESRFGT